MPSILHEIVVTTKTYLEERKKIFPFEKLFEQVISLREQESLANKKRPSFYDCLIQPRVGDISIIAEIKRLSPSLGIINSTIDHCVQAQRYIDGGADALSVLTNESHFGGKLDDLRDIASIVPSLLPILRKDFIVDEYQILEAYIAGASAVLLIVGVLTVEEIEYFLEFSSNFGLDCLVEVHTERELEIALQTKASIIGINTRDLVTFSIDLAVFEELAPLVPKEILLVAESGIQSREDVLRVKNAGADSILVGTALMRDENPLGLIRGLKGLS